MKNIERWAKKLCKLAAETEYCLAGPYDLAHCSDCDLHHVCTDTEELSAYMMADNEHV